MAFANYNAAIPTAMPQPRPNLHQPHCFRAPMQTFRARLINNPRSSTICMWQFLPSGCNRGLSCYLAHYSLEPDYMEPARMAHDNANHGIDVASIASTDSEAASNSSGSSASNSSNSKRRSLPTNKPRKKKKPTEKRKRLRHKKSQSLDDTLSVRQNIASPSKPASTTQPQHAPAPLYTSPRELKHDDERKSVPPLNIHQQHAAKPSPPLSSRHSRQQDQQLIDENEEYRLARVQQSIDENEEYRLAREDFLRKQETAAAVMNMKTSPALSSPHTHTLSKAHRNIVHNAEETPPNDCPLVSPQTQTIATETVQLDDAKETNNAEQNDNHSASNGDSGSVALTENDTGNDWSTKKNRSSRKHRVRKQNTPIANKDNNVTRCWYCDCKINDYFYCCQSDAAYCSIKCRHSDHARHDRQECVSCTPCFVCGKTDNLMRCSICRQTWYCSKNHQVIDWPNHSRTCKPQ